MREDEQSPEFSVPNDSVHARRLQACLFVACAYLGFVAVLLALRLEAHRFGFLLREYEQAGLRHALALHTVGTLVAAGLVAVVRTARITHAFAARLALASLPIILVLSADRIAAISVQPIRHQRKEFIAHATRGWMPRPGSSVPDGSAVIRINSRGLRGPDIPLGKVANELRVLFLGDSVTFGSKVDEEACFVRRVETLARQSNLQALVTTINASVPAYSPWHEHDLLVTDGLQYDPDLVVQVFCLNDVLGKFQLERFGGYSRGYEPPPRSIMDWSGCYRAVQVWWAAHDRPDRNETWYLWAQLSAARLLNDPDAEVVQRGWKSVFEDMTNIVTATRNASVPLIIVCAPHRLQFLDETIRGPSPQSILAQYAREHDVLFLDLLPVFREYFTTSSPDTSDLFLNAMHFSSAGHELASKAIFRFLSEGGWLGNTVDGSAD